MIADALYEEPFVEFQLHVRETRGSTLVAEDCPLMKKEAVGAELVTPTGLIVRTADAVPVLPALVQLAFAVSVPWVGKVKVLVQG
jgi:hypothetical protein